MSTIPGLYVIGEANFSDHGANRLGASALMQGLADGYFILPYTIGDYLAGTQFKAVTPDDKPCQDVRSEVEQRMAKLIGIKGKRTPDDFHRELGKIMWDNVGMGRNKKGLEEAMKKIAALRAEFWQDVKVVGSTDDVNNELERAGRVADFLELGELLARDAHHREESCGGHFREEHQTEEGEAKRNDKKFAYVAAWEFAGDNKAPVLHKEALEFEYVKPSQRSYK
jgi:succinate dehydrogenase / fumarate reductase flavoprotein subunit